MKPLRSLAAAFSYFSVLPVRSFPLAPDSAAIGWLPLVGLVLGAAAGSLAYAVFVWTNSPMWPPVAAFGASLLLSGAIHIDGFLDCADALLMTAAPQRRLDVLKDPHHGSYAIVAMAVLAAVWIAALSGIAPREMPVVLAFAAACSRAAAVSLSGQYPHARTGMRDPRTIAYGIVWFVALALAAASFARRWEALAVLTGAYAFAQLVAWVSSRRLAGGLTGDVYGAIVVVTEVAALIAAPSLAARP